MINIPNSSERDYSSWRIPLCFATAAIVTALAWLVAWKQCQEWELAYYSPQTRTWRIIKGICENIDQHRQKTGKLPATLAALDVDDVDNPPGEKKRYIDVWGNPLGYQIEGDKYVVISFGADGKPGGADYDADLQSDRTPDFVKMTLWEFTTESRTSGMKICCLLGGIIAFPLCLLPSRPRSRGAFVKVLALHTVTAVFTIVVAVVMSAIHVPTGH